MLNDEVISEFKNKGIDIFQTYGVIPILNIHNINNYSGKFEFEITEEDFANTGSEKLLKILTEKSNIISLSVDDVSLLYSDNGTDGIKEEIKDLKSNKKYYNKGLIAMLKSEFIDDFITEEKIDKEFFDNNKFLKEILTKDFTANTYENNVKIDNFINILRNSNFFVNLPKAAQIYINDIIEDGNYTQLIGAIRGILTNTVERQLLKQLKQSNRLNISTANFRKHLEYEYRLAYLTLTLQLIIDGKQKEELDFIEESVTDVEQNVNNIIRKIVRENDFKIEPLSEDLLKNYGIIEEVLIDKLSNFEIKPEIQYSIQNLKKIFAAA